MMIKNVGMMQALIMVFLMEYALHGHLLDFDNYYNNQVLVTREVSFASSSSTLQHQSTSALASGPCVHNVLYCHGHES